MIIDAAEAGRVTTTVTIIGFCVVAAVWRFGHNLHAAIDKRDEDEAEDAQFLARVARSIDAMDESERARFELFV